MIDMLLADRAIRDLLNSITVTGDIVTYRAERPLTRRIIDVVSGQDARISELIDEHSVRSVENLLALTSSLNDRVAFSDETQAKMIRRLKDVARRLGSQGVEVDDLRRHIVDLEDRLMAEIALLIERADSRDSVEQGLAELRNLIDEDAFTLVDLWRFADRLWWGGFGLIQRRPAMADLAARMRTEVIQHLQHLLRRELNLHGVFSLQSMLAEIPVLPIHQQEELGLLMLDPDARTRPLSRAIVDRAEDRSADADPLIGVPILTTVERLGERLFDEARRSGSN